MSDNDFDSAMSDDSLRSITDSGLDKASDNLEQLKKIVEEEKITTTTKINSINERIVDEKFNRDYEIAEIHITYLSRDAKIYRIMDEDRETISNEIIGLHTRIDKNIDECKQCIRNISILDARLNDIKDNLIPSKSLCVAVTTLYALTGICIIHAGGIVLPLIRNLIKK